MGATATVPILPGVAVSQKRSYASYPKAGAAGPLDRGSDETINFRPHQPPRDSSLPRTSSTLNAAGERRGLQRPSQPEG